MNDQFKIFYYEWFLVLLIVIGIGGSLQFAIAGMPIETAFIIVICVFFIRLTKKKLKRLKTEFTKERNI